MAAIKGRNTAPELAVRSYLHRAGFRFRLSAAGLPCRPDLVLTRDRIAIFVHGCFWHQHPGCRHATTPKVRTSYWGPKLRRNRERDKRCRIALQELGWTVLTVWECEAGERQLIALVHRILRHRR